MAHGPKAFAALAALLLAFALVAAPDAAAYSGDPTFITGLTQRDGGSGCTGCHTAASGVTVTIAGPSVLARGATGTYTVTFADTSSPFNTYDGLNMGVAIAASSGTLNGVTGALDAVGTNELVHNNNSGTLPVVAGGDATYTFQFTMPGAGPVGGDTRTLYATSRVGVGSTGGGWEHAANFTITNLNTPSGLAVTGQTDDQISLDWAGDGPTYRIVYKTGGFPANSTDGTVINTANATSSRTITGLSPNTTYYFRVYSRSAGGLLSSGSDTISGTTDKTAQSITWAASQSPSSRSWAVSGTFNVNPVASATSGLTVSYAGSGACTGSGTSGVMTMTALAGTCTITASQAGNGTYLPALSIQRTVTINATVPGAPTPGLVTPALATASVAFTASTNTGGDAIDSFNATCAPAGSGSGTTSPLTITGLAANTSYTCTMTATNTQGPSAPSGSFGFTTTSAPAFTSAASTSFTVLSPGTFTVSATGNPAPTLSLFSGTPPSGVTFTAGTGALAGTPGSGTAGTYNLTFRASSASGTTDQSFTLTVSRIAQSITFAAPAGRTFGDAPFVVSGTGGGSGNPVTFTSASPAVCTATGTNGTTITIVGAGTCSLDANQAAGTNHDAAPTVNRTFNVAQAGQSISFGALPGRTFGVAPFTVAATGGGSGNPVQFASVTAGVCTATGTNGATLTIVGTGTCTIQATQAGNANYLAAAMVPQSFLVSAAAQAITFGALAGRTYEDPPFAVSATGGASGNPVTFSTSTTAVCTVAATTVTIVGAGNCTVDADQAGNGNYSAAPRVSRTFAVARANQVLLFGPTPAVTVGTTGTVTASGGGSGNPVTFASTTPATCTVAGNVVTGVAAGACTVSANQAQSANYNAATQITLAVTVGKGSQSIAFGAAPAITYLGTGNVVATGGASASPVTFATLTPTVCSVSGSTVTGLLAGACTVAADQAADANYNAATQATQLVTIARANQAIGFGAAPALAFGGTAQVSATGGGSGNAVTFTSLTPAACTVAGSLVTAVGSGTCTVAGNQAGDANHNAAPQATQDIVIGKAAQSIAFGALPNRLLGDPLFVVSASASSGLTVAFSSTTPSVCSVAGIAVTMLAAGQCTIAADQAGDLSYLAAPRVTQGFLVIGPAGVIDASPASVDFGGQSMNTTSAARTVTFTNVSGAPLAIGSVVLGGYFAMSHDCTGTLAAGGTCTATVTFTPGTEGALPGTLTVLTASGGKAVGLAGTGERSLVTHYYRSILRRAPDAGGKAFWESEAARMQGLGANVNETWFAMAGSFFASPEYAAFGRDGAGFVTDLYATFFNRAPDAGGFAFWTGQLAAGMPREVALVSFMFSPEFAGFTQALFGNPVVRSEVDTVMDFYRGLLGRLPDDGGYQFWLGRFRQAQCIGEIIVRAEVESISSQFASGPEYASRARGDAQYVGDLYNAFLRRGGDLGGVQFWIGQLAGGAMTREVVRRNFVASPEFNARVLGIVAQGCHP